MNNVWIKRITGQLAAANGVLLMIGETPSGVAEALQESGHQLVCLPLAAGTPILSGSKVACVFLGAADLGSAEPVLLLSRLRDSGLLAVWTWITGCTVHTDLPDPALVSLGFVRIEHEAAGQLWLYDIEIYNQDREWNNADNWANPENFTRYRW